MSNTFRQIFSNYRYQLLVSKKDKYVYCVISKNGCSSILSSILYYDYDMNFDKDKKIWSQDVCYTNKFYKDISIILLDNNIPLDISQFEDYKIFMVLRNPYDRMISYINHTYKEKIYDNIFDKSLSSEEYVNAVIDAYPFYQDVDRHAVPQRKYYDKYIELFGDKLNIVMIENLPEYYKQLTGNELIKNNVTRNDEKVCTWNTLSEEQKNKIREYIKEYEFTKPDTYSSYWNA